MAAGGKRIGRRERTAGDGRDVGDGRDTGVGATARRGVGGGFLLVARIVMVVTLIIVGIIVAAILLKVLGANNGNSLVKAVHDVGKALVGPFKDIFTVKKPKVSIAVNWGVAAAIYFIVGSIIARILRGVGVKSHPDRAG